MIKVQTWNRIELSWTLDLLHLREVRRTQVYLFQYPVHEVFVALGDVSKSFSMRDPSGSYNNNSLSGPDSHQKSSKIIKKVI